MEFVCYEKGDKLIRTSGEGCINTYEIIKRGIQKVIWTRHLLRQHWVLVFSNIRTLVISCNNIWFITDINNIRQKMRGVYWAI